MKLSNIAIIFIIIVIPIILLLSYYISLQIDTINMQTSYTTKQLQATKEAVDAFEINTVEWNSAYYTTSDSKRRDVMGAINTFTTSFANSIGVGGTTKETMLTYIPAVVCTLYDGYYIYSPSEVYETVKDANGVTVTIPDVTNTKEDVIKGHFGEEYTVKKEDSGKILYQVKDGKTKDGTYTYKVIKEDGTEEEITQDFTLDIEKAKSTYEHILKPYSTYSARYKTPDGKIDITVGYTLDNYITIRGMVNDTYVEKAGYYIDPTEIAEQQRNVLSEKVAFFTTNDNNYTVGTYKYVYAEDNTKVYFQEEILENGETEYIPFQVNSATGKRTDLNGEEVIYKRYYRGVGNDEEDINSAYSIEKRYDKIALNTGKDKKTGIYVQQGEWYNDKMEKKESNEEIYIDHTVVNCTAVNARFTMWVDKYLKDVRIENLQIVFSEGISDEEKELIREQYGNTEDRLFPDPYGYTTDEDSTFSRHKKQIIKQSLISSLQQAITSYSGNSESKFKLPIFTEDDWNKILRNVSIVTFVQNIPIGMKYYNNYVIATSTLNNEYVNPDEIYLIDADGDDNYYHRLYCNKLNSGNVVGYRNTDFVIQSYSSTDEYGKEKTEYYYKHGKLVANEEGNKPYQACYYCIVQRSLYIANNEYYDEYKSALARERYVTHVFK